MVVKQGNELYGHFCQKLAQKASYKQQNTAIRHKESHVTVGGDSIRTLELGYKYFGRNIITLNAMQLLAK